MTNYFAIVHDGTLMGDCIGDPCDFIELTTFDATNCSLDKLKQKWLVQSRESDYEYGEEDIEELKGAWIVNEHTKNLVQKVAQRTNTGGDSSVYTLQGTLKVIIDELAVRKLGSLED